MANQYKVWNFGAVPSSEPYRHEEIDGRQYIVVPMVMILEGVHTGSQGPVYYSMEELAKTPKMWNMKPIVLEHPFRGDSATDLEVYKKQAVGIIQNTEFVDGKLKAEAWIDIEKAQQKCPEILEHIQHKLPMEVSTGLFSELILEDGNWRGESYKGRIVNIRGDHLAILPHKQGACSLSDGAGLLINESFETKDGSNNVSVFNIVNTTNHAVVAKNGNATYVAGSLVVDDDSEEEEPNENDAELKETPQQEPTAKKIDKEVEDDRNHQVFTTADGYKIVIIPPENPVFNIPEQDFNDFSKLEEKEASAAQKTEVPVQDNAVVIDKDDDENGRTEFMELLRNKRLLNNDVKDVIYNSLVVFNDNIDKDAWYNMPYVMTLEEENRLLHAAACADLNRKLEERKRPDSKGVKKGKRVKIDTQSKLKDAHRLEMNWVDGRKNKTLQSLAEKYDKKHPDLKPKAKQLFTDKKYESLSEIDGKSKNIIKEILHDYSNLRRKDFFGDRLNRLEAMTRMESVRIQADLFDKKETINNLIKMYYTRRMALYLIKFIETSDKDGYIDEKESNKFKTTLANIATALTVKGANRISNKAALNVEYTLPTTDMSADKRVKVDKLYKYDKSDEDVKESTAKNPYAQDLVGEGDAYSDALLPQRLLNKINQINDIIREIGQALKRTRKNYKKRDKAYADISITMRALTDVTAKFRSTIGQPNASHDELQRTDPDDDQLSSTDCIVDVDDKYSTLYKTPSVRSWLQHGFDAGNEPIDGYFDNDIIDKESLEKQKADGTLKPRFSPAVMEQLEGLYSDIDVLKQSLAAKTAKRDERLGRIYARRGARARNLLNEGLELLHASAVDEARKAAESALKKIQTLLSNRQKLIENPTAEIDHRQLNRETKAGNEKQYIRRIVKPLKASEAEKEAILYFAPDFNCDDLSKISDTEARAAVQRYMNQLNANYDTVANAIETYKNMTIAARQERQLAAKNPFDSSKEYHMGLAKALEFSAEQLAEHLGLRTFAGRPAHAKQEVME